MKILYLFNYWIVIVIMLAGLYAVIASSNLVKKIAGLSIFQASVFILYISSGKILGGTAPIVDSTVPADAVFSNPLPHVLILTAIVVGVATTAVGAALIIRIHRAYGSIEENEILEYEE